MPDFLETVKNIVKNKLYNPSLRWRFKIANQQYTKPEKRKHTKKSDAEDIQKVYEITNEYKELAGVLVPVLQRINSTFNYLPEHVLRYISEELNIPLSEVYWIATFYNAFSLHPRGRNIVKVCLGTSCYVKGGKRMLQTVEKQLGIKVGQNTSDLKFSLETVNCIGCCGQSPVMSVNDDIYGYVKQNRIHDILKMYS